jgi:citrate lyase subunit beta/citryl-CoA lyase
LSPVRNFLVSHADDKDALRLDAASDADGVFMDLEDGVAPEAKERARLNIVEALQTFDYGGKMRVVRVNSVGSSDYERDLAIVRGRPDVVLLPKVSGAQEVLTAAADVLSAEDQYGIEAGTTKLFVMIESAIGVVHAYDIFSASPHVTGVFFGVGDLTLDVGSRGVSDNSLVIDPVIDWAGHQVVLAAKASGLEHIVGAVSDCRVDDGAAVEETARQRFAAGFTAVMLVSRQLIEPARRGSRPTEGETRYAHRIVDAFEEAKAAGRGACMLQGQLLERPFYEMAKATLQRSAET